MANWKQNNSVITTSGIKLLSKAQIGLGTIEITRVIARDVESTADENKIYTMENIPESSIKQAGTIINANTKDEVSHITARFSNEKLDEEVTFTIRQVIVIARLLDLSGNEIEQETPYFVLQSEDGGDIMPPKGDTPASFDYHLSIVHTGVATVNITIQPSGFVSQEEFEDYKSDVLTDKIAIQVRINQNINAEVGQKTENLDFKVWKPDYTNDREWSRSKNSTIDTFKASSGSERFNYYNEDPETDVDSSDISKGSASLGANSHAEGTDNLTYSVSSHIEGANNYSGFPLNYEKSDIQNSNKGADYSHVEGLQNTAIGGACQHIEGFSNFSNSSYTHVEGSKNKSTDSENCHVQGLLNTVAICSNTSVSGSSNDVSQSSNSIVSGLENHVNKAESSIINGYEHDCSNVEQCSVFGYDNSVTNSMYSNVCGNYNRVFSSSGAVVQGSNNFIENSSNVLAVGDHLNVKRGSNKAVFGQYNLSDITNKFALTVGGGTEEDRRDIFKVDWGGNVISSGSINSGSADLAEYFEWKDNNSENEDRRGLFVTLNEDKIELANNLSDYVLGCVSARPCLVGNNPSEWSKKYKTDVFGCIEYETVETVLEDGTKEVNKVPVLNPDFKGEDYIPRSERPEWDAVALHGRVVAVDDGTCEPNGYCKPYKNGVATKSENGFRVLKRIDDTHILVWIENAVKF